MHAFFIMSSERSGSNLLRKMLGAHPRLSAPPPPHLWRHLTQVLPYYGPLVQDNGFEALLTDALALTQVPGSHLQWKYPFTVDEIRARVSVRSLGAVIAALYDCYAAQEASDGWVCKENNLFDHAFQILETRPEAKFIYLCRDGRDVACSVQRVPSHDQHLFFIAQEWRTEQEKCLRVYQELHTRGAAMLLRYEDLLENPEPSLICLCDFLKIEYHPQMLAYHEEEETKKDAAKTQYWQNLDKPVLKNNKAKFLAQLSPADIRLFEQVAGPLLQALGYPLLFSPAYKPLPRWQYAWFWLQNRLQRRRLRGQLQQEPGRAEREKILTRLRGREKQTLPTYAAPLTYPSLQEKP